MTMVEQIAAKVRVGERISGEEALVLWREAPLWLLGELAVAAKYKISGDKVFYNCNFHLEPTNLCVFNCKFCSYRRPKGSPEAWDYSMEQMEQIVRGPASPIGFPSTRHSATAWHSAWGWDGTLGP